jgi:hypothetical protein
MGAVAVSVDAAVVDKKAHVEAETGGWEGDFGTEGVLQE